MGEKSAQETFTFINNKYR